MTFQPLINILKKQKELYESLYLLAVKKMEIVKKNNIDALNQIMKDEQTHISAIHVLESEREQLMEKMANGKKPFTLSDCINIANNQEKEVLTEISEQLVTLLEKLKEQNDLNQQLLYQSLQFINFSLNLLNPEASIPSYGPQGTHQGIERQPAKSLFNSKV